MQKTQFRQKMSLATLLHSVHDIGLICQVIPAESERRDGT